MDVITLSVVRGTEDPWMTFGAAAGDQRGPGVTGATTICPLCRTRCHWLPPEFATKGPGTVRIQQRNAVESPNADQAAPVGGIAPSRALAGEDRFLARWLVRQSGPDRAE